MPRPYGWDDMTTKRVNETQMHNLHDMWSDERCYANCISFDAQLESIQRSCCRRRAGDIKKQH
jgi:hypothetical protein